MTGCFGSETVAGRALTDQLQQCRSGSHEVNQPSGDFPSFDANYIILWQNEQLLNCNAADRILSEY